MLYMSCSIIEVGGGVDGCGWWRGFGGAWAALGGREGYTMPRRPHRLTTLTFFLIFFLVPPRVISRLTINSDGGDSESPF